MLSILHLEDDFAKKSGLNKVRNKKATFVEEMAGSNADAQFSMAAGTGTLEKPIKHVTCCTRNHKMDSKRISTDLTTLHGQVSTWRVETIFEPFVTRDTMSLAKMGSAGPTNNNCTR
ncbi:hypothetical protein TSUD_163320 [Trifolium subterraneum]|uniref:Uncharacterized protein n=1 Tax=Trifolium subterraneum TaxID=3900 RepID=A0A2Z6NPV2_TRISU|nr:hypothetical protein TSUD_163320 [Trifolium subterraneum]